MTKQQLAIMESLFDEYKRHVKRTIFKARFIMQHRYDEVIQKRGYVPELKRLLHQVNENTKWGEAQMIIEQLNNVVEFSGN